MEYRLIHTGTAENNPRIGRVSIVMSDALGMKVKEFVLYDKIIILVKIDTKFNTIQL